MKKIIIDFKPTAWDSYDKLSNEKRMGGLAKRYYEEMFDFPPERWGKLRKEFGKITFVSDNHVPFIIKVIVVEEQSDSIWLYVTEFRYRKA
ncbi:MAG TPA: hypothetical protein VN963_11075 [bacterium]|jgi:hypothetical protein|nr:hypothetical protein [bacterium]